MIKTADALENVDEIASEPGFDVLLVGSNDLACEIRTLGDFDHPRFIEALQTAARAAQKYGKIFAIAGVYTRPGLMSRVINEMGARWV